MTPEDLRLWSLNGRSFFRMKFFVLGDALARYECPCVYLDSDTYFRKSPSALL